MGANAVFCKPMDAVLPILAAQAMSGDEQSVQNNLFYVLILPPLVYSCLQLVSWKRYTLVPDRVKTMRRELKALLQMRSSTTASSATLFGDV